MDLYVLMLAGIGAVVLLWPWPHARRAASRHARRLEELRAGAPELYFEERSALEAYHPVRREAVWRLAGAGLILAAWLSSGGPGGQ